MKTRTLVLILIGLVFTLFFLNSSTVLAQDKSPVRVIQLSSSGYERGHAVAFSSDGEYLAVGGTSGVYVFDFKKLSFINFIQTKAWARSVAFLPNTDTLAAGLFDQTIKLWDISDTSLLQTMEGPRGWVRSISVSSDGSLIASASDDDTLRVWDIKSGASVLVLNENANGIRAVAISPDGKLVAGAPEDNTIRIWSIPDGKLIQTLSGHTSWVRCLTFSPDGKLLASGGFDKTVRLWDLPDGKEVHMMEGHSSSVLSVAFSPDGSKLASGSVDQTLRLWQVATGEALQVLKGHIDFVYAVAFSPDGKTLASGGGDNSVRIWDLKNLDDIPFTPQAGEEESVSSDCRACHHRRGQFEPARVIELSCEGCHAGGISLSWCAGFPRAGSLEPLNSPYQEVREVSGVPVNDRAVAVVISSPGNGETFYVKGDYLAPKTIHGKIFYAAGESITKVNVKLEILSGGQKTASLVTYPSGDGDFSFEVDINPGSPPAYATDIFCRNCHGRVGSGAGLPGGDVRIVVTATTPEGGQAVDERWIRVDSSQEAAIPVEVLDGVSKKPISGLLIQASTVLYEWRARTAGATSDANGNALLYLESLSQSSTVYQVNIPPQIVNGLLYVSAESVQVTLEPGVTSYPRVSLLAHSQAGSLTGEVTGIKLPDDLAGIVVWAVQLPGGPVYKVPLKENNTFAFAEIPISRYLVFPDPFELANHGFSATSQEVDLADSPDLNIGLECVENRYYSGKLVSEGGKPIPFAWVRFGDKKPAIPLYALSDKYLFPDPFPEAKYLTFSAPGYYSHNQNESIQTPTGWMSSSCPDPEMQAMAWGDGQVFIPPETDASMEELGIEFKYGWLWGSGGSSTPLQIHLHGFGIAISRGDFSLEFPPDGIPWFYLDEGNALVTRDGSQSSIELGTGQMIALVDGAMPLPLNQSLMKGYHPPLNQLPISDTVEPSLKAQFEDRLVRAGISIAQVFTFFAYGISIGVLIAIPVIVLMQRSKKHRKPSRMGKY